jgi:single-strand DNA-binding protein
MAAQNINRVIITGNLTRDPEQRSLPGSGTNVTSLRVACNGRRKNNQTQQWEDKPNYFDVTIWGAAGDNAARYLSKGRGVAIDGRLDWREWTDKEGNKRQTIEIVADTVQFLSDGSGGGGGGQGGGGYGQQAGGGGYGGQQGGYDRQPAPAQGGYDREPAPAQGGYDRRPAPAPTGGGYGQPPAGYDRGRDVAVDTSDFAPAPSGAGLPDPGEDDIPF